MRSAKDMAIEYAFLHEVTKDKTISEEMRHKIMLWIAAAFECGVDVTREEVDTKIHTLQVSAEATWKGYQAALDMLKAEREGRQGELLMSGWIGLNPDGSAIGRCVKYSEQSAIHDFLIRRSFSPDRPDDPKIKEELIAEGYRAIPVQITRKVERV
jgi:hypothetical protein